MIVLEDGRARVEVVPEQGAAIGRYDFIGGDGASQAIFQTAPSAARKGPFALGLNLLVPFSNRISGGGFMHDGVFHPLERNSGDPYPIHGDAFTLPWTVTEVTGERVTLTIASDGPGPFRYDAEVTYALDAGALTARLTIANRAPSSLPFGAGFHPWFVRSPEARLTLRAAGYWTETEDHLPADYISLPDNGRLDFTRGRKLPEMFVNNALTGWDGAATLAWPDRGLAGDIAASPPLTTIILYSPDATCDYVCIEPVSHSVDAHNRSGTGVAPPQVLQPEETLVVEMTVAPHSL